MYCRDASGRSWALSRTGGRDYNAFPVENAKNINAWVLKASLRVRGHRSTPNGEASGDKDDGTSKH